MRVANYESKIGRIPITRTWPCVENGRYPVKAFLGEVIEFGAIAFREGHDLIAVDIVLTSPGGNTQRIPMTEGSPGKDQWLITHQLDEIGLHSYQISAYASQFETWLQNTEVKLAAGLDQELMMLEGAVLLEKMAAGNAKAKNEFQVHLAILRDQSLSPIQRLQDAMRLGLRELAAKNNSRDLETLGESVAVLCERKLAGSGSWYEFFPRSEGATKNKDGSITSGNFKTAIKSLQRVHQMGFEVLYLPPIHPIGTTHRKGPNNSLMASETDPGSPWAIGSSAGGHDAIHPELGTEKDFRAFVSAAKKLNIEIALDLALQASPDHPWVKTNPEWFTTLADGSIAHAENPPKKYQDIYPINFDNDPEGIFKEVLRILEKWIELGVSIFRVDNPHTKPVSFWERLIQQVRQKNPEVIFLAEAFTRPAMVHALGKIGFQQGYCYFSWRNSKQELAEYLAELAKESADFFRPNLWVNTPDILTQYLQFGGKPAFKIRATIAATAGSSWGMYAGFELYEAVARTGAEENIDSEKFEIKLRSWPEVDDPESLMPRIKLLNQIRKQNPALQQLRNLKIHHSDDPEILVYSKHLSKEQTGTKANTIIVICNTDPHSVRETSVHLDLESLEVDSEFQVLDLLTGAKFSLKKDNYVKLDSFGEPAHIFLVER